MGVTFSQFFPPSPSLTEANLPNQKGKVFIITGGYSGVGHSLASILYNAGGKVYIAGRSTAKAEQSIQDIQQASQAKEVEQSVATTGELEFLPLQLDDLTTIKSSVQAFLAQELRLDVLFNNAGISLPPLGSVSVQGHELQLATNCLGPLLLAQLLSPVLQKTAGQSPDGAVRVVWTSSQIVELSCPTGGITMSELNNPSRDQARNYVTSKMGNWYLASELSRHQQRRENNAGEGTVLHIVQNPGNLQTNLLRNAPWMKWFSSPLLYPPIMGAYTELWAGLSSELGARDGGVYVVPWGRVHPAPRRDLMEGLSSAEEGGSGKAGEFLRWCEEQVGAYR